MNITYQKAIPEDIEPIYELCRQLIHDYKELESIDYPRVMNWVRRKIESSIEKYTVVYANGCKAGYYHFYKNEKAVSLYKRHGFQVIDTVHNSRYIMRNSN